MDDRELIEYCNIHAETQLALFHAGHVKRMFELAGRDVPPVLLRFPDKFWSLHEEMKILVEEARARTCENLK